MGIKTTKMCQLYKGGEGIITETHRRADVRKQTVFQAWLYIPLLEPETVYCGIFVTQLQKMHVCFPQFVQTGSQTQNTFLFCLLIGLIGYKEDYST